MAAVWHDSLDARELNRRVVTADQLEAKEAPNLVFRQLPQREAGTRQTLRYIGEVMADGYSILIFPEGKRTETGEINHFMPGIGMIASRLGVPVVPVRLEGLEQVLHHRARMARRGHARIAFGKPMRLEGDDYAALARQVEEAVRAL